MFNLIFEGNLEIKIKCPIIWIDFKKIGRIKEKKRRIKKHFRRKMSQGHEKVGKSRNIVFLQ